MPVLTIHYSDQELITQAISGNDRAFKALVTKYGGLVYHFVLKRLSNPDMAEDITQEVFIKVYQGLKSFDPQRAFRPWLLRIANNTVISAYRRAGNRIQLVSMNALQEDDPSKDWVDNTSDPSQEAESSELSTSAKEAILKLEERYQDTLKLRYLQELSYSEIAEAKGIPINTVKTWIKRGTEILQQQMKGLKG